MSRRRLSASDAPLFAWGEAMRARRAAHRSLLRRAGLTVFGITLLIATAVSPPAPRLIWNASPSVAEGLYWVNVGVPAEVGDIVIAHLSAPAAHFAEVRHYLPATVPLVKRVVASAGDIVCSDRDMITINGRPVAQRLSADRGGRALPRWHGCQRLHSDQVFLLSSHPASFDGRYFGVTKADAVVGTAVLLWAR